ncbi:MAG TPA: DNA repair protein RecO [Usitatibacter sp.]|jgi:DNA repair protein RecO (recombination protein O)|nr:DNA repair protein RecO [Usitatibacter sp.]
MNSAASPLDKGYVLHSYAYRETSLILQAWTEKHGRFGLVAKGVRRPRSANRSLLVPFQPLLLSWFGRGELKTLKVAEPAAPATPLAGESLMSGFYLNELLLKLTSREDPHEALFEAYDAAIGELRALSRRDADPGALPRQGGERDPHAPPRERVERVLRRFELRLLQELGYAVEMTREAGHGPPIAAEREYFYMVERGAVEAGDGETPSNAVRLRGRTLIDLESGNLDDPATAAQAKQLMRLLINHSLNGQELATRALVRDLRAGLQDDPDR